MTQVDVSIEARKAGLYQAHEARRAGLSMQEWLDSLEGTILPKHLSQQELQACWNLSDHSWAR